GQRSEDHGEGACRCRGFPSESPQGPHLKNDPRGHQGGAVRRTAEVGLLSGWLNIAISPVTPSGWYRRRVLDGRIRSSELSPRRSRRIQQQQQEASQIETPDIGERKAGQPQNEPEHAQHLAQSVQ